MSNDKHTVDQQRRRVMKGIAATAAASAVIPQALFAAGRGPTAVVIGAGIAGLSAAWNLRKAGFQVAIFEKENLRAAVWYSYRWGPCINLPML